KDLRAFHAKPNTIVLNGRDRRLRDPREGGKVVLTQLLKLAQDPNRLSDGDLNTLLRRTKILHLRPPVVMSGERHHENPDLGDFNSVDDTPLDAKPRGAMSCPLPRQRFVVKALDQSQSRRARHGNDVLPFL